jgi:adenylate kinase family enzyme
VKKILIVGGTASGKSTLAQKVSEKYNLSLFCTDQIVWRKWRSDRRSDEEIENKIKKIVAGDEWVLEGVHGATWMKHAFKEADYVVILCLPFWLTVYRMFRREFFEKRKNSISGRLLLMKYAFIYYWGHFSVHKDYASRFTKETVIVRSGKDLDKLTGFLLSR